MILETNKILICVAKISNVLLFAGGKIGMLTRIRMVLLAMLEVLAVQSAFQHGMRLNTLCVNERPPRNRVGVFICASHFSHE